MPRQLPVPDTLTTGSLGPCARCKAQHEEAFNPSRFQLAPVKPHPVSTNRTMSFLLFIAFVGPYLALAVLNLLVRKAKPL